MKGKKKFSLVLSLSKKKADLEYAYGWNRYTMTFLGIWPEHRNRASRYKAIVVVLTWLCFCCVPQSANLPLIWGDFDLMIENLSMANITITLSLLKTVIFLSKGGSMRMLMSCMAKDWNVKMDKQNRKTMLNIAKFTRKLSIRSTMFVLIVVLTCLIFRYIAIRDTGRQMIFRGYFPYNVTNSPFYELTFFGQVICTICVAINYSAVDTFIATLVLHICGQLSNLRRELTDLYAYTKAEFQAKLGNIVRKHEYLNRFAEMVENSFNVMLLIEMLGCSMQLCFQCLHAFMSIMYKMDEIIISKLFFLLLYVIYILLQLYLYCYIGEKLLVESTKVAYAAYECNWYNLSAREARLLTIIMCRARSPLYITAGRFCSFNRELFTEVIKKSVTYMSCVYAMNSF